MSNFFNALKRGLKAATTFKPEIYLVADKQVVCPHCGSNEFALGSAQLNTTGMTFVGLDWADKSAYTLMCAHCGRIEWFGQKPESE